MSRRGFVFTGDAHRVPYVTDPTKEIPETLLYPDFMRQGFRYGEGRRRQTVFLDPELAEVARVRDPGSRLEGLRYVDTVGWPSIMQDEDNRRAAETQSGGIKSAVFLQEMLRRGLGDESILLKHVVSGIDPHDLFSYREFGFTSDLQGGEEVVAVDIATPPIALEDVARAWEARNQ